MDGGLLRSLATVVDPPSAATYCASRGSAAMADGEHARDEEAGEADGLNWPPGSLELRVLRVAWQHGRVTVRSITAHLAAEHPVAYTTVMTVMSRLTEKGLLRRERVGKTYYYAPALSPDAIAAKVSQQLLHSLIAEFGDLAIAQFSAELDRVDPDRLHRLRQAAAGGDNQA